MKSAVTVAGFARIQDFPGRRCGDLRFVQIRFALLGLLLTVAFPAHPAAADPADPIRIETLVGKSFPARDTLDCGDDGSADARECLAGLVWKPAEFEVTCEASSRSDRGDLLVRFPSSISSGDERNDLVSMEWYVAQDASGNPLVARAVVVVHESGSRMPVGRLFARGLRMQGLHALLIHLPYYGERRTGTERPDDANMIVTMRQAIADVRRARDAVAALPLIDTSHVGLQGTSLGGFVSATAASLDGGYDSVFLMLAGGNLYDLIENGEKDAAKVREAFAKGGLTGEMLKSHVWTIEPTRVAHRLDPARTWLYSGSFDTVVPLKNAIALAKAAKLDRDHHIPMLANHYSGIVFLPTVLADIHKHVTTLK